MIRKEIDKMGTIRYYRYYNEKGQLHREDGLAMELVNGDKYWYLNGQRHREDGPAIEYANGDKEWYLNGKKYPGPYTDEEWQNIARKILLLGD